MHLFARAARCSRKVTVVSFARSREREREREEEHAATYLRSLSSPSRTLLYQHSLSILNDSINRRIEGRRRQQETKRVRNDEKKKKERKSFFSLTFGSFESKSRISSL
jgi:hypothetical protein